MERIIAGRFQSKDDADAVAVLIARYIDAADICVLDSSPPGQHDAVAVREDAAADAGANGAVRVHHGQVVALAAEGINAYSGPLVGAMAEQGVYDDKPRAQERRRGRYMLSVRITDLTIEKRVIANLRAAGAADILPENRKLRDGDWANFNVSAPAPAPRAASAH